jgi:hypothetical protein
LDEPIRIFRRSDTGTLSGPAGIAQQFVEGRVGKITQFIQPVIEAGTAEPPLAINFGGWNFTRFNLAQDNFGVELQITRGLFNRENFGGHANLKKV